MGYDPIRGTILVAKNELPCTVCRGSGRTRYALAEDVRGRPCPCDQQDPACWMCSGTGRQDASERVCQSCWGTRWEPVKPETKLKADEMLLQRIVPTMKQIDHVSTDGSSKPSYQVAILHLGPDGKVQLPAPQVVDADAQKP